MTKRICPYETNVARQFKIHINDYESDCNALKYLKEQTLKKLLDGSKRLHFKERKGLNDEIIESTNFKTSQNCDKKFLQKCVTNYFTINGKLYENDNCKLTPTYATANRCFFCENITNSLQQCIQCLEFYCNSCSFIRYEFSLNENRICMSCIQ